MNNEFLGSYLDGLVDKTLIKIFKNTFSGGDSRLQCLNYQKKNDFLLEKNILKEIATL